jgi:hypothetical protein
MFNNGVLKHRWEERCYQVRDMLRTTFGLHWFARSLARALSLALALVFSRARARAIYIFLSPRHIYAMLARTKPSNVRVLNI